MKEVINYISFVSCFMYVVIISCSIRSDSSYCLITSVKKELGVDFFTKGEEVLGV